MMLSAGLTYLLRRSKHGIFGILFGNEIRRFLGINLYGIVLKSLGMLTSNGCYICLGRLPTAHRLLSFGLDVTPFCHFCVGDYETDSHLFVNCSYSTFILGKLAGVLQIPLVGST